MHDESDEEFELEFDWEISLRHLFLLHFLSERRWDINGELRFPTPLEIESKAKEMVEGLREFGGGAYITLNGLKVYKDPEFPDSYEVYVLAGHASPRIPKDSK